MFVECAKQTCEYSATKDIIIERELNESTPMRVLCLRKEIQMMKKLHRNRYKNVVVAMMMVFFMFVGMGTIQVHAAEYTTGTFDPAQFEVGDKVYKGIQLSSDRLWFVRNVTWCGLRQAPVMVSEI